MLRLIGAVTGAAAITTVAAIPSYIGILLACGLYTVTGGWNRINLLLNTFNRDMKMAGHFFGMFSKFGRFIIRKSTLSDILHANVRKNPQKPAFTDADTGKVLTFKQVEDICHGIANVFHEAGYQKGDCVAIVMENRVEYMPVFFGLSMIGVTTSFINCNLKGESLRHCISICNCKAVIFSSDLAKSVSEIQHDINAELFSLDPCDSSQDFAGIQDLSVLLATSSTAPLSECSQTDLSENVLYMYTSGTTGLPKAVAWPRLKVIAQTLDPFGTGVTPGRLK